MNGYGMAACVKVCGWRADGSGAADTGAGVRKPPKEETAGGVARFCVRRYGDFDAGGLLPRCVESFFDEATSPVGRSRHAESESCSGDRTTRRLSRVARGRA
jgi:hypothetical protein